MFKRVPPSPAPDQGGSRDQRLPQRWAIILILAALAGGLVATGTGAAGGVTAFVLAVGVLHAVLE